MRGRRNKKVIPAWKRAYFTSAGVSLTAALMFAESVPLSRTLGDVPRLFTVNFFLPRGVANRSALWLLLPALPAFAWGLSPGLLRRPRLSHLAMVGAGLSFFPLAYFLRERIHHTSDGEGNDALLWSLLGLFWLGAVLWVREPDYLWSSAAAGALWDMGAAVRGYQEGIARIGVPYHPGLPPARVIAIDAALFAVCAALWAGRADPFPRRKGWLWRR